jgi:tRNA(Ile)-lysidine synthase
LAEWSIPHILDSSNETDDFLRNRLRHYVMPLLEEENPRLVENFADMIEDLRGDEAALDVLSKAGQDVPMSQLAMIYPALRRRWLKDFLERNGVKEPERRHILLAESLVFSHNPSASANFPGGVTIERCYDQLRRKSEPAHSEQIPISGPGTYRWGSWTLTVEETAELTQDAHSFVLQGTGGLCLRPRSAGDHMRLPGGTKSLKKLYIDRKIPASERPRIPVLADADGVLGVPGLGVNLDRCPAALPAWRFVFKKENET